MLKETKRIQVRDLKVGDCIKSKDEAEGVTFKKVLDVFPSTVTSDRQVHLVFKNGSSLSCSDRHPIMVDRGLSKYVEVLPRDLLPADLVITEFGFTNLDYVSNSNFDPNYLDLTVEETHTFFVSKEVDTEMILTHNSQGAVRGASACFYWPLFHMEFETLIELKNSKGTPETRLTNVDYGVQLNKTMYERLFSKGDITFFSPEEVPDLYEAFFGPAEIFKALYEKYENDPRKTKKTLPAIEVFTKLVSERYGTGRIYIMNVDHANTHGSYYEPVYLGNLCSEIALPTTPMGNDESLIALCTLSAVNFGKVQSEPEMAEACEMAVRALDELLDYQDYPNEAARRHTKLYRPLGVGIIGLAHDLTINNLKWGNPTSWQAVEDKTESMAYYLTRTSVDLAEWKGACTKRTKFHDGVFPMDTCKGSTLPKYDWGPLKDRARAVGIRNGSLMTMMPSETSSQLANETSGIDAPKALVTAKGSKDGRADQLVPDYAKYGYRYELAWDIPVSDYLNMYAGIGKYTDQSMSVNTNYNPNKGEITIKMLLQDLLQAYSLGIKNLYYSNVFTDVVEEESGCEGGGCKL